MVIRDVVFDRNKGFALIAGPCVIENEDMTLSIAEKLKKICLKLNIGFIFKSSFDKANRISINSFRGPGMEKGLKILQNVSNKLELPVLTDIHSPEQASYAAEVVDVIQIPAFLMRQTDILVAAAKTGKVINIKKAQFASVSDLLHAAEKVANFNNKIMLTERGTMFGYGDLVVDFRNIELMKLSKYPVIFDATHSVQKPGGAKDKTSGNREFVPALCRAAVAVGVDALFLETHPDPENALSDSATMWPLDLMEDLLKGLINFYEKNKI